MGGTVRLDKRTSTRARACARARERKAWDCKVTGCENAVRRGMLMCGSHWHQVPRDLRLAVNRTWRALSFSDGNQPETYLADLRAYRETAARACAALDPTAPAT